jgi:hypothetical protein
MKYTTLKKWYRGEPVFITVKDKVKHTGFIALNMETGVLEYRRRITDPKKVTHVFKVLNGIGIDVALLTNLKRQGVKREVVWLDGKLYSAPLDLFESRGLKRDFGYNNQYILPLGYWTEVLMDAPKVDGNWLLAGLSLATILAVVAALWWLLRG